MGKLFVLISQFVNKTNRRVGFEVSPDGYCPVRDLPPGKTRQVKLSRILRWLRKRGPDWKIRVLVDDQFTGIEINPQIVLKCTRILFRFGDGSDSNVLLVEGVLEKFSDFWLRLKYFGFMRDRFWDGRKSFLMDRSDSRMAKKLRDLEGHGQRLASFLDTTLLKRSSIHTQSSSPMRKAPNHVHEQYYSASEDSSDENSWGDTPDDSSSHTTDSVSTTRDSGGIRRRLEENAAPPRRDIGRSDGVVHRRITREPATMSHHDPDQNMDSFEYGFLFCFALGLVLFIPKLFF